MYTYSILKLLSCNEETGSPVIPGIKFIDHNCIIDESYENHFTQIMFLLKKNFYNEYENKIENHIFDKSLILNLFEKDKNIYKKNFINSKQFIKQFPKMVDYFLEHFCVII